MHYSLSLRAAELVTATALVTGWQAFVAAQEASIGLPGPPSAAVIRPAGSADLFFVPGRVDFETDVQKLLELFGSDPDSLNPEQLRILDGGLESNTRSLTEQLAHEADDARRRELHSELAEVVQRHFTLRQAIRNREIGKLEQEVARLRQLLQERENARQQIVQGRIDQLIRSAEGLGWDAAPDRTPVNFSWALRSTEPAPVPVPAPAAEPAPAAAPAPADDTPAVAPRRR